MGVSFGSLWADQSPAITGVVVSSINFTLAALVGLSIPWRLGKISVLVLLNVTKMTWDSIARNTSTARESARDGTANNVTGDG